jgi:HAD superfamily hydrolase (TIGR01509 family)
MLRAVVFDFDGLIVETETPVYQAWAELFAEHGQELSIDFWKTIVGTNSFDAVGDLEARIGHRLDRDEVMRLRRARELELAHAQPLQPGVLELVAEARAERVRLAVASSSSRRWVIGHLERRGLLECFECIRCRDDVGGRGKPDPAVYLAVVECLGVAPDEAVAIEDSPHGLAAARAAGLRCVAVPGPLTAGLDLSAADLEVASVADLDVARLREVAAGRG